MKRLRSIVTVIIVVALAFLAGGDAGGRLSAAGQAPGASAFSPPRTPDGQPDMQGMWANAITGLGITGLEPSSYLRSVGQPTGARRVGNAGNNPRPAMDASIANGLILDPPDRILPYQPWAKAVRDEVMKKSQQPTPEYLNPLVRGWPSGIPRENYYTSHTGDIGGPLQILQPQGYVVFFYETHHEFRIVPLDGRPHVGAEIKLWEGDSRGHWEGNTLVVEVTSNDDTPVFDNVSDFHSDEMRVTERWTIVDRDTLDYKATIDDPKVYTRPWTIGFKITRSKPGTELIESATVEGDTASQEIDEAARQKPQQPK